MKNKMTYLDFLNSKIELAVYGGFGVWDCDKRAIVEIATMTITQAMERVKEYALKGEIHLYIEDARIVVKRFHWSAIGTAILFPRNGDYLPSTIRNTAVSSATCTTC